MVNVAGWLCRPASAGGVVVEAAGQLVECAVRDGRFDVGSCGAGCEGAAALAAARRAGVVITDEASAVEALGLAPRLVAGRRDNLKITHPDDLALAVRILAAQADESAGTSAES